jgi:alpha-amylase
MMYSGYAFDNNDVAPTLLSDGKVADVVCADDSGAPLEKYQNLEFACQHRWNAVEGMIAWRATAGQQKITEQKGDDGIFSFGRGKRAHLVMNSALYERDAHVQTQLAPGEYCDLISGGRRAAAIKGKCLGATITIDSAGYLDAKLASMSAVAISKDTKLN